MIYFSNFVHCLLICVPVTLVRLCFVPSTLNWNINNNINYYYYYYYSSNFNNEPSIESVCVCVLVTKSSIVIKTKTDWIWILPLRIAIRKPKNTKTKRTPIQSGLVGCVASSGTLLCRGKSLWMMKIVLNSWIHPNQTHPEKKSPKKKPKKIHQQFLSITFSSVVS